MSAPKSVVKIDKDGVKYTSSVDAAKYYLFELSRAALRDVGKYVKNEWKTAYKNHFKQHTKDSLKATSYTVLSNKKTQYPRVEIGLKGKKPKNAKSNGFYAYYQEFGSSTVPKLGLLTKAVENNIAEIVKIESQYLSALSDEASRLEALIDEDEMTGEDDE